jgi:signal transduction histidine kinase
MIETPDLAFAGLAAGTLSAFVLAGGLWRSRRQLSVTREEITGLESRLDSMDDELAAAHEESEAAGRELDGAWEDSGRAARLVAEEVDHLAKARIPAAASRALHPEVTVPGPLDPDVAGTPLGDCLELALATVPAVMAQERARVDAAARAAVRGATRDVRTALHRFQERLRALQRSYDDPALAEALYALDHGAAQSLRRAQITAVVCGDWAGPDREESHLVDAVAGGLSRLADYRRVRTRNHLAAGTALVAQCVEPVAIVVAELVDNALRHSPPESEVTVEVARVPGGVSVTVDDAGAGMTDEQRARAQRRVAGHDPVLLSELGDPPRMGLAAIGRLTRRFDLSVDLSSPSPRGGVRAVLLIGEGLLSRIDPVEHPPSASAPRSVRPAAAGAAGVAEGEDRDDSGSGERNGRANGRGSGERNGRGSANAGGGGADDGLPQRRARGRGPDDAAVAVPRARTPEDAATALGALQAGTAAARAGAATVPVPVPDRDAGPGGADGAGAGAGASREAGAAGQAREAADADAADAADAGVAGADGGGADAGADAVGDRAASTEPQTSSADHGAGTTADAAARSEGNDAR